MTTCPECGAEIRPEWRYCPFCGHPLRWATRIPAAYLEFLGGPDDGRTVPIQTPLLLLGRRSDNDLIIGNDRSVSRRHALLSCRDEAFWVADLGSKRGTWLNGEPALEERALRDGDIIALGQTRLRFGLGEPAAPPQLKTLDLGSSDDRDA